MSIPYREFVVGFCNLEGVSVFKLCSLFSKARMEAKNGKFSNFDKMWPPYVEIECYLCCDNLLLNGLFASSLSFNMLQPIKVGIAEMTDSEPATSNFARSAWKGRERNVDTLPSLFEKSDVARMLLCFGRIKWTAAFLPLERLLPCRGHDGF